MIFLLLISSYLFMEVFSLTCVSSYFPFTRTCPTSCGFIDYNYTTTYTIYNQQVSYDWQYQYYECGNSSQCTELAGSENGCTKVSYDYYTWVPTGTCTNGEADGATQTYYYETYYGCCKTDNCNYNYDTSKCVENQDLQDYVTDLNDCWYDNYQIFVDEMYCQHKTVYDWTLECSADGQWNSTYADVDASCYYQLTCSDDLIEILKSLARCGCAATNEYNYDSATLETYLSDYYSIYCNNVQVECEGDNALLVVSYWYIKWSFKLTIEYSSITDAIKASIKSAIATNAKVSEETVTVTFSASSSNNRRLLQSSSTTNVEVSIKTQDESSASTVQNNVNDQPPSSYASYTTSDTTTATTTSESQTYNAGKISNTNMLSVSMVAIIVFIMTLFN